MAEEYRVQIIHSAAHTSNQNGKIERARGVIIARSRSLIIHAKIPRELWPEAMQAAVYLINRTPVRDRSVSPERWISPYERLYGQKPNLANIRVFGCKSYVLRHDVAKADKMAPRAWIGYLVGFEASNLWRIWNPRAVRSDFKVTSQRDVTFNETEFYDPQKPLLDDVLVSEIPRVVELNEPTEQISQHAIEPQGSEIESDSENEQTEQTEQGQIQYTGKAINQAINEPLTPESTPAPIDNEQIPGQFPAESPQQGGSTK
jgi:hypothetical protein